MNEMTDADKILFHQWVHSEDATAAFTTWKAKQLKSLKPITAPDTQKPRSEERNNPAQEEVQKKVQVVVYGDPFQLWDEHVVRHCQRDPYN